MSVRKVREWLDSIDPENADPQTFTELEDTLTEVEMTVNDLDSALVALQRIETYPEHVSRNDEHKIRNTQPEIEELYERYSNLLVDVREKFRAVDEHLYAEQ